MNHGEYSKLIGTAEALVPRMREMLLAVIKPIKVKNVLRLCLCLIKYDAALER
jgi:hypothetical protein